MGILSNVTNWASDAKDKVTSTVKNATSSIGTWLNDTYNNSKTASVISTPSASTSSSSTTTNSTGSSNIYDSTNKTTTTKTPTQYSSLAAYETDKTKNTTVENIQKSLNTLGYTYGDEGELKIDGDFGIKTQTNWDNFISDLGVNNYLSGIASTSKNVSDFFVNNKSFDNYSNINDSTLSEPTGDEYLFYGNPITEFKKNVLGLNDNSTGALNNGYEITDAIKDSIFAASDALKNGLLDDTNLVINEDSMSQILKNTGKYVDALGKVVDVGTILKDIFVDDDMRSAVSNLGGIAGGVAGSAIVAPMIVGAFTGPAAAVMVALIGITCALTGKEATELVYDLLHENEN